MNKIKILSIIALLACSTVLVSCTSASTGNFASDTQLRETNFSVQKLAKTNNIDVNAKDEESSKETAAEILEKISRINRYYDMEQIADVFGEWPLSTDALVNIKQYWYQFGNVEFSIGLSNKISDSYSSAYLSVINDVSQNANIYLGLYDFDEKPMKEAVSTASTIKQTNFKEDVKKASSDGLIDDITDLEKLVAMLSKVKQNSTVEELTDIFRKAPKDISDGIRDKFVYYSGEITIVIYDSPFTYMELFVSGGSVKVMFSGT